MSIKLHEQNGHKTSTRRVLASNELNLDKTYFVAIENGTVVKADSATKIVWVNETRSKFWEENTTLDKREVVYIPKDADRLYEVSVAGVWMTENSVGQYFNLSDAETVEASSGNPSSGQLELVKFVSEEKWIFKIA